MPNTIKRGTRKMKTKILERITKDVEELCRCKGIETQCHVTNEAPKKATYENIRIVSDYFDIKPSIFDKVRIYGYVTTKEFEQTTMIEVKLYCRCYKGEKINSVRYYVLNYNIDTTDYMNDNPNDILII